MPCGRAEKPSGEWKEPGTYTRLLFSCNLHAGEFGDTIGRTVGTDIFFPVDVEEEQ
jgi:hypothetical protein